MQKKPPKITIPMIKMVYQLSKKKIKKHNLCVVKGGVMSEVEWNRKDLQEFIKK